MAIYYLCPDDDSPAGGIRSIYRHVDILRRSGLEAFVVHERRGFRCAWFENDTPILSWCRRPRRDVPRLVSRLDQRLRVHSYQGRADRPFLQLQGAPSFKLSKEDVIVVPEVYGPHIADIAPGVPKVILNQNVYFSFRFYSTDARKLSLQTPPYRHPEVIATIVKTRDAEDYLRYAFPRARVLRVRNSIDPTLFYVEEPKEPWIGYMPRRNAEDGLQAFAILAFRGVLVGYDVIAIDGLDEVSAAALMRRCLVFVSLGSHEGFGRPPAEAMACGAAVVGYHGNGGREFFRPEFANPVTTADVTALAKEIEKILTLQSERPDRLRMRRERAAKFIHDNYSPQAEEGDLLAAWNEILATARDVSVRECRKE
jgi:glycosyltransferase involved in cell wall biosynthesis